MKAVPQGSVVPFWESFVVYTTFLRRPSELEKEHQAGSSKRSLLRAQDLPSGSLPPAFLGMVRLLLASVCERTDQWVGTLLCTVSWLAENMGSAAKSC